MTETISEKDIDILAWACLKPHSTAIYKYEVCTGCVPFRIITLPGGEQIPLADYVEDHGKELSTGTADLLQLPGGR